MAKLVLNYVLAGLFFAIGIHHQVRPNFYRQIMPPYLPAPALLVMLSGVAEIILGLLFAWPTARLWAGFGLVALLIAVFPANLHMALHSELWPKFSPLALWLRLPLQLVMIGLVLLAAYR